jgi:hypothetical protein
LILLPGIRPLISCFLRNSSLNTTLEITEPVKSFSLTENKKNYINLNLFADLCLRVWSSNTKSRV